MLFAWITDLILAGARYYADAAGDCTWDRQHYFLSLVVAKLPTAQQQRKPHTAAWVGGGDDHAHGAAGVNLLGHSATTLIRCLSFSAAISPRDLILLLGGLFLIWKASKEDPCRYIEGEEEG